MHISMAWGQEFSRVAQDDIAKLDRALRREIIDKLAWVAGHFEDVTPVPLHAQWKGFFKVRIGDWRAVYTFDAVNRVMLVHFIDHRSKIYKRRI